MLQKDGFFRKRDDGFTSNKGQTNSPAPAAVVTPSEPFQVETKKDAMKTEAIRTEERRSDERKEAKLVVGPDIKMKGVEISDCDTLVVEGRMEATLDSRVLEITSHGVFHGTIAVDQAEIHGKFDGEITVRKQLVIHATGKVSGKIRYAKIKIEEGAEVAGDLQMLDKAQAAVRRAA